MSTDNTTYKTITIQGEERILLQAQVEVPEHWSEQDIQNNIEELLLDADPETCGLGITNLSYSQA